jgi:hypothetical protein
MIMTVVKRIDKNRARSKVKSCTIVTEVVVRVELMAD